MLNINNLPEDKIFYIDLDKQENTRSVEEVNRLLKQFEQMQKMMKMMKNGNMKMPF